MANLQYIGARYVPKFYLNPDYPSGDTRTNDWKSGVDYEALTIVTYNNDSYTSKIPVPDSVGNPLDNPRYWACTTKYTAALVALQNTVGSISESVDDILDVLAESKSFVTPQMYGAVGDGVTDDSAAFIAMITDYDNNIAHSIYIPSGTYFIDNEVVINKRIEMVGLGFPYIKFGANGHFKIARRGSGVDYLGVENSGVNSKFSGILFGNDMPVNITLDGESDVIYTGTIFTGLIMYLHFETCWFFKAGNVFECAIDPYQQNIWWGATYFNDCTFNRCSEIFHVPDNNNYPLNQVYFGNCTILKSNIFFNKIYTVTGSTTNRLIAIEEMTFNQCDIENSYIFRCITQTQGNIWTSDKWQKDVHTRNLVINSSYIEHTEIINCLGGSHSCDSIIMINNWITFSRSFIQLSTPLVPSEADYCAIIFENNNINITDTNVSAIISTPYDMYHVYIKTDRALNRIKDNSWRAMTIDEIVSKYDCSNVVIETSQGPLIANGNTGYQCYNESVVEVAGGTNLLKSYDFLKNTPHYCTIYPRNSVNYYRKTGYGGSIQVFNETGELFSLYLPAVRNVASGNTMFQNQTKLVYVKWLGNPSSIASNLFNGCTALTDIYVPWSSTDPLSANAPWGATNATVHYDTV